MDVFTNVPVSVHRAYQICRVLPKSTTEERMREPAFPLLPFALFLDMMNTTVGCCNWQPKVSLHESRGEKSEGTGHRESAPWVRKCPLTGGYVLLHKQGLACGDSVCNKFSHPRLQTLGQGLKMEFLKSPSTV